MDIALVLLGVYLAIGIAVVLVSPIGRQISDEVRRARGSELSNLLHEREPPGEARLAAFRVLASVAAVALWPLALASLRSKGVTTDPAEPETADPPSIIALALCALEPKPGAMGEIQSAASDCTNNAEDAARLSLLILQVPLAAVVNLVGDAQVPGAALMARQVRDHALVAFFDFGSARPVIVRNAFDALADQTANFVATERYPELGHWLLSAAMPDKDEFLRSDAERIGQLAGSLYDQGRARAARTLSAPSARAGST